MKRTFKIRAASGSFMVLFALIGTACAGGGPAADQSETSFDIGPEPAISPEVLVVTSPTPPGGHVYGATLDEWTETEQREQESEPVDQTVVSSFGKWGYAEIQWTDLIPDGASGEELMARFEEELEAVEAGSEEATELFEQIRGEYDPEAVNIELDGEQILLAGFIAPLTYDDDVITEFLLVPTFGACVHVPPPPPNQTIMVSVDRDNGLSVDDSWGAVWVEGTMLIESATNDLGATSYRITDATSGPYNRL